MRVMMQKNCSPALRFSLMEEKMEEKEAMQLLCKALFYLPSC
jgi:hypothetical protein